MAEPQHIRQVLGQNIYGHAKDAQRIPRPQIPTGNDTQRESSSRKCQREHGNMTALTMQEQQNKNGDRATPLGSSDAPNGRRRFCRIFGSYRTIDVLIVRWRV
jgi:hypothetical protein